MEGPQSKEVPGDNEQEEMKIQAKWNAYLQSWYWIDPYGILIVYKKLI